MIYKFILIFYVTSSLLLPAQCSEKDMEQIIEMVARQYIAQNEAFNKKYDSLRSLQPEGESTHVDKGEVSDD